MSRLTTVLCVFLVFVIGTASFAALETPSGNEVTSFSPDGLWMAVTAKLLRATDVGVPGDGAVRLYFDLSAVPASPVTKIFIRNNLNHNSNLSINAVNWYVASDESAPSFDPASRSSYSVLAASGTGDFTPVSSPGAWHEWTLTSPAANRYWAMDVWSNLSGAIDPCGTGTDIEFIDMVAVTGQFQSYDVNGLDVAAVNGDTLGFNTVNGGPLYQALDADGDGSVFLLLDQGAEDVMEGLRVANRWDVGTGDVTEDWAGNDAVVYARIWVAADETIPGFDPYNTTNYTTLLEDTYFWRGSQTAMDDPCAVGYMSLPTNAQRRYALLEIYRNATGPFTTANRSTQFSTMYFYSPKMVSLGRMFAVDSASLSGPSYEGTGETRWYLATTDPVARPSAKMVIDLGETRVLDQIAVQNRAESTNDNPSYAKIFVADESDPCFDPFTDDDYTIQINPSAPADDVWSPSTYLANTVRSINVTNVEARYVMIEFMGSLWAPHAFTSAHKYIFFQDLLLTEERKASAGRIFGIGGDSAGVGSDSDPCYPLITAIYNYPPPGDPNDRNEDGTIDFVVEMSERMDVQYVTIYNRFATATMQNIKNMSLWVTGGPADPHGEFSPTFDPTDQSAYTTQIYADNIPQPGDYQTGTERQIDVTDINRQFIRVSISSNYRGEVGTSVYPENTAYVQFGDIAVLGAAALEDCAGVTQLGLNFQADVNKDCTVDDDDLYAMADNWLACSDPETAGCDNLGLVPTYMIPEGTVTVDGDLSEWVDPEWYALDKLYAYEPCDIVSARFALKWNDTTNLVYVACQVTDADHIKQLPVNWDSSDRIEIYAQGDPNGGTGFGSGDRYYDKAQQYAIGPNPSNGIWATFGSGTVVPIGLGMEKAISVDGDTYTYEIGVPLFIWYGGLSGATTVPLDLDYWVDIGFDVIADTRYAPAINPAEFGMRSENLFRGKWDNADQFQLYSLVDFLDDPSCGSWGFHDGDVNMDCDVNLVDFVYFVDRWMMCNDPSVEGCIRNW